jgi:hypothetical protein
MLSPIDGIGFFEVDGSHSCDEESVAAILYLRRVDEPNTSIFALLRKQSMPFQDSRPRDKQAKGTPMRLYIAILTALVLFAIAACQPIERASFPAERGALTETLAQTTAESTTTEADTSGPTGVAAVDALVATIAAGDEESFRQSLRPTTFACTTAEGLGGPPKCLEGMAEGTEIIALPVLDASATYTTGLLLEMGPLAAAYRVPPDGLTPEPDWPLGDYALIYGLPERENAALTLFADGDGRIVRATYHWLSPRWGADSLLPAGVEVLYRIE